jgi:hypothetical protein
MLAAVRGGARERDDASALAEPVAVLEHVGERVPVVPEVIGQRERLVERREQRRAILRMREVDRGERSCACDAARTQRLERARPRAHARVIDTRQIGSFHSRILAKEL